MALIIHAVLVWALLPSWAYHLKTEEVGKHHRAFSQTNVYTISFIRGKRKFSISGDQTSRLD